VEWSGPCKEANQETAERLEELAPDLIITSNWTAREWVEDPVQGFVQAWEGLTAPVLVIADNPAMLGADKTTDCIVSNYPDTRMCARSKDEALPTDHQLPAVSEATDEGADVSLIDLTDL